VTICKPEVRKAWGIEDEKKELRPYAAKGKVTASYSRMYEQTLTHVAVLRWSDWMKIRKQLRNKK